MWQTLSKWSSRQSSRYDRRFHHENVWVLCILSSGYIFWNLKQLKVVNVDVVCAGFDWSLCFVFIRVWWLLLRNRHFKCTIFIYLKLHIPLHLLIFENERYFWLLFHCVGLCWARRISEMRPQQLVFMSSNEDTVSQHLNEEILRFAWLNRNNYTAFCVKNKTYLKHRIGCW